jgi:hypothetical protein
MGEWRLMTKHPCILTPAQVRAVDRFAASLPDDRRAGFVERVRSHLSSGVPTAIAFDTALNIAMNCERGHDNGKSTDAALDTKPRRKPREPYHQSFRS